MQSIEHYHKNNSLFSEFLSVPIEVFVVVFLFYFVWF